MTVQLLLSKGRLKTLHTQDTPGVVTAVFPEKQIGWCCCLYQTAWIVFNIFDIPPVLCGFDFGFNRPLCCLFAMFWFILRSIGIGPAESAMRLSQPAVWCMFLHTSSKRPRIGCHAHNITSIWLNATTIRQKPYLCAAGMPSCGC